MKPLRVLTFTTLFPDPARPTHGIFVGERLRHLLRSGAVEARVVAPVPWFPIAHPRLNPYVLQGRQVARREEFAGVEVLHPRYFLIPKLGMSTAPWFLARAALPVLTALLREGFDFDLIDAHYFYPDGVAAEWLGRRLQKPVVITARGTDLNLIPRHYLPRRMIAQAAHRAAGLITVSAALREVLVGMGIAEQRVRVVGNGVDLEKFAPVDRQEARARLGMTRFTLLSVGYLIDRKGHDVIIRALPNLPEVDLWIVGEGHRRRKLQELAEALGVAGRVRLVGEVAQARLRDYYGAADLLVLASDREGLANVLLEAMACGTRVAATRVWGAPEAVTAPEAGMLMDARTPEAIVAAVAQMRNRPPDPGATRRYAERFSWEKTSREQLELFLSIIAAKRQPQPHLE
ncbi:MAG: glycosyltransferase family 4 protein [Magnetococcales bacterium]|nr:glycosyltransferase family 4 protein [Magnetococcales bacterium]